MAQNFEEEKAYQIYNYKDFKAIKEKLSLNDKIQKFILEFLFKKPPSKILLFQKSLKAQTYIKSSMKSKTIKTAKNSWQNKVKDKERTVNYTPLVFVWNSPFYW